MELKGSVFLVTGGASGLGEACVRRFAKAGAKVVIVDRDEKGLKLASETGSLFHKADVSSETDIQGAIALAESHFGALDGAVNCAGIGTPGRVLNKDGTAHDLSLFSKIIQVNLIGTFNVCRLAAAAMAKRPARPSGERGVLINTASVAAFEGQIGQVAYAASKGGIVSMALPLARDLSKLGIRVNTIAPGIFETPLLGTLSEEVRASLGQQVPFPPRLGRPDEFAFLAQHIVENEMLNGEVIRLDGAIRMAPR